MRELPTAYLATPILPILQAATAGAGQIGADHLGPQDQIAVAEHGAIRQDEIHAVPAAAGNGGEVGDRGASMPSSAVGWLVLA